MPLLSPNEFYFLLSKPGQHALRLPIIYIADIKMVHFARPACMITVDNTVITQDTTARKQPPCLGKYFGRKRTQYLLPAQWDHAATLLLDFKTLRIQRSPRASIHYELCPVILGPHIFLFKGIAAIFIQF